MKRNIIAILIAGVFTMAAGEVLSQDKPEVNTQQDTPVKIIEYIPGNRILQ
jgi:hypothetical protein